MADLVGTIQFKRGTAAEWAASSLPLLEGEIGVDLDSMRIKLGDGATLFPALPWATPDAGLITELQDLADAISGAVTPVDLSMAAVQSDPGSAFSLAQNSRIVAAIGADANLAAATDTLVKNALGGTRKTGIALSHSAGSTGYQEVITAIQMRVPLIIAASTKRWRLHIRNYNDRDAVAYTGSLSFTGIWFGSHAIDSFGLPTGNWGNTPTQVAPAFTTASDASEYVSPWVDASNLQVGAYKEHLIGLAWTGAAGQNHHKGVGTCWRSATPADVSALSPSGGLTLGTTVPLDIWVEVEVGADVPVCAYFGDSLVASTGATYPIRDSWPHKHALSNGHLPFVLANHGSTMANWADVSQWKWQKYATLDKPDAVIKALGTNDIDNGATLATLQSRHTTLAPILRDRLSPRLYDTTIMPRNGSAYNSTKDAVRISYNDWLDTLPLGIIELFDFSAAVTTPAAPTVIQAKYITGDNVHLTSAGCGRLAATVPHRLAAVNRLAITAKVTPYALPFSDYTRRGLPQMSDAAIGSTVNVYSDLAGFGADLTPGGAPGANAAPTLVLDGGYKGIAFDGSTQGLGRDMPMSQPHTLIIVARYTTITTAAVQALSGGVGASGSRANVYVDGSAGNVLKVNAGSTLTGPAVDTNKHVFLIEFNTTTSVSIDGGTATTGSAGTNPRTKYTLANLDGTNRAAVIIFEDVLVPRALTSAEKTATVALMKLKHGIA